MVTEQAIWKVQKYPFQTLISQSHSKIILGCSQEIDHACFCLRHPNANKCKQMGTSPSDKSNYVSIKDSWQNSSTKSQVEQKVPKSSLSLVTKSQPIPIYQISFTMTTSRKSQISTTYQVFLANKNKTEFNFIYLQMCI